MAKTGRTRGARSGRTVKVVGVWECDSCGNKYPGTTRECPRGCGSPRELEELQKLALPDGPLKAASAADTADLSHGQDKHCPYCGRGMRADNTNCGSCEGSLEEASTSRPESAPVRSASPPPPRRATTPPPVPTPRHSAPRAGGGKRHLSYIQRPGGPDPSSGGGDDGGFGRIFAGLGIVMAIIAFIGLLVWGFTAHEVDGQVASLTGTSTAQEYNWTQRSDSDWARNLRDSSSYSPSNGKNSGERAGEDVGYCRMKEDPSDTYVCGTTTQTVPDVCVWVDTTSIDQSSCTDDGAGGFNCGYIQAEDCTAQPDIIVDVMCNREHRYCDYTYYAWASGTNHRVTFTGHTINDPTARTSGTRHVDSPRRIYTVGVSYMDGAEVGSGSINVERADYLNRNVGDTVPVMLNNFGSVSFQ